jgi:hypothetical protein
LPYEIKQIEALTDNSAVHALLAELRVAQDAQTPAHQYSAATTVLTN